MTTRIVELRQGILKKNDELARGLRGRYTAAGVLVLNLVSSPGTGKTAFLERTLRELLARGFRAAALVGDLETDNDARRLAASGAPVRQINTHGICHLDAEMIERHLTGWEIRASQQVSGSASQQVSELASQQGGAQSEPLEAAGTEGGRLVALSDLDYLFIENVGNLVCPSSYDLGEKIRVALLSVTEGEDKPLKYPTLFNSADAAVITKIDIAEPCGFDRELALRNINEIRPGIRIFETSSKTGAGMEEWLGYLAEQLTRRAS
jgi:hydrogenase nickel incorporation protein HypB